MATMTEISEKLSRSLLSQVCGSWGLPNKDMSYHLSKATKYWETDNAMRGLHKAMTKIQWPMCTTDDSEDEGGGGDRQKRPLSASSQNKRRMSGQRSFLDESSKSPRSTSTGGSSKSSPSSTV